MKNVLAASAAAIALIAAPLGAMAQTAGNTSDPAVIAALEALSKYQQDEATAAANLKTFDTLDFEVYSHQDWDRLGESHAEDILVHYPDGSTTTGLHDHIAALSPMFVFAPDTRIEEHPVRIGSGEWTAVIGSLKGTFTEPMPIGEGKVIEPTGKAFTLGMATIGRWNDKGVMAEEYLFWDNQDFMKQIGLAN